MARICLIFLMCFYGIHVSAQNTFIVTNSGLNFTPALVNAKIGDKITFSVGPSHPVLQVGEATYLSNGDAALNGGFSYPSGAGTYTATEAGTIFYICVNHISSGMKGKIIVTDATGIQNHEKSSGFEIYPNPATETITISNVESSNPLAINVFDISGKKLMDSDNINISSDNKSVNIRNLRKGIYFISVSYSDKTVTKRFLKL